MGNQDNFKSRLMSAQKPLGRRKRKSRFRSSHYSIDLMELHQRFAKVGERRRPYRPAWIRVAIILIAIPSFFLMGYFIAALSVSTWLKVLLAIPVAVLGLMLSYIVAALSH